MWRTRTKHLWAFLAALLVAGCGGEDPVIVDVIDPNLEPYVGIWDAEVFEVTSDADPQTVADIMVNGSFTINVEPSGTYTATLVFGGIPLVEIGLMSASQGIITLRPNGGEPVTSAATFLQPDYVRLEGPTEFDFNLDQVPEPAQALIEIRKR